MSASYNGHPPNQDTTYRFYRGNIQGFFLDPRLCADYLVTMRRVAWLAIFIFLGCTIVAGCSPRKLDEVVFYEGPQFKLKLVRYYENLPFHYTGKVFRVQCSSANTVDSPGHEKLDPGWVEIGSGGAIGSTSAKELVNRERTHYLIVDDRTLVTTGGWALKVSFDACGSFRFWDPTALPLELIDPVDKPATCAPPRYWRLPPL